MTERPASGRSVMRGVDRQRALVLVPHEPTLDPRVHYTSQSLAKRYAVTVLAIVQEGEERPPENEPPGRSYVTVRIPLGRRAGALRMLMSFAGIWLAPGAESGRPGALRAAGRWAALAIGLVPALAGVLTAGALRVARPTLNPLLRRWGPAGEAVRRVALGPWVTLSALRFAMQASGLLCRAAAGPPQLVYCHDLYSLQAGVLLKRRFGARLAYDSHEYYPYQHPYRCYAPAIRAYESVLIRELDVYITVSPQLAAELQRAYGVPVVHAIPNVEPVPVPRPSIPTSAMSTLAQGRLKLLFQGVFAEGRGLEEVLREWRGVDGTRAALFLRGPESPWRERVERLAEDLGVLGKSVYVVPAVLERDLIAAAQEADVGLVPYTGDSPAYRFACPNKLSQYLHAGLAILANRIPYVEEVVTRAGAGLCYDVREAGSFARAVATLAADRAVLGRLRGNARRFAEREYNWERYEDMLLAAVAPP